MARARTGPQMADRELARLLRGYTIEVTTHNQSAVELCRTHVAPGTEVYIAFVPGEIHHAVVGTAARLHAAGFVPVPHVTARSVASPAQLRDFLARLAGEAGVTRALVIAGDLEQPAGPYRSSLELLQTGLFQQHGIRRIGLACYPEAHRRIEAEGLERALLAKLDLVRGAGLEAWLVTQFCFEAAPILQRVRQLRDLGVAQSAHAVEVCPALRHRQLDPRAWHPRRRGRQSARAPDARARPARAGGGAGRRSGARHRGRAHLHVRRRRQQCGVGERRPRRHALVSVVRHAWCPRAADRVRFTAPARRARNGGGSPRASPP
jgi:hypothetical protein